MPNILVSDFVKNALNEIKNEENHTSYDSTIRSLLSRRIIKKLIDEA